MGFYNLPQKFFLLLFGIIALGGNVYSQKTLSAQKSDTVRPEYVRSDTVHKAKKKHKLLAFVKKAFNKSVKNLERQNTPNVAGVKTGKSADTSKSSMLPKAPSVGISANGITGASNGNTKSTAVNDTSHKTSAVKSDSTKPPPNKSLFSKLDHLTTHGSISAGYDYGVLPFASDLQVPMGYFHSEGQGQFNIGALPFNASYYYSDITNISGLSNYARVSFDAQKFRQEYSDKESQEGQKLKGDLGQLYKEKQVAEQKLLGLTSIQNQANIKAPQAPSLSSPSLSSPSVPSTGALQKDAGTLKSATASDSLGTPKAPNAKTDSLSSGSKSDSASKGTPNVNPQSIKSDSAAAVKSIDKSVSTAAPVRDADSVKADIQKYQKQIDGYDKQIDKITKQLNSVNKDVSSAEHNNPYMKSVMNFMSGFKKLEVGLCYPDYSTFLVSGMAVKGINLEYQRHGFYVAATEGTTVNTLLFTNNNLQNHLVNMQNLYNMFDFTSVQNGRKVLAVKGGWGQKDGTHLYVGVLYGTGLPSYLNTVTTDPTTGLSKNYVLEVDGKWAISKNSSFNLVYGKSSTQTQQDGYNITDGGLIASKQSNAILGKYNFSFRKTQTKLTLTGRWIDPYFNSFGVAYMRADNFRYEIKAEQPFGKKIKVTVFYRKDEDDILQIYQDHTVLQTIGTNTTIKLMRSLTLRIGYSPVIEHMWGDNPTYSVFNNNSICNVILSYVPTIKNLYTVFNTSYNYYRITTDTQTIAFQNFSFSNMTRFKNSISNNIAINWFKTTPADTLNNDVWVLSDNVSYTFHKGFTITIGGKSAYSPINKDWQWGYLAKIKVPLVKHLSCNLSAEKLVIGDFYSSLNILQIERFPYFLQGQLVLSW